MKLGTFFVRKSMRVTSVGLLSVAFYFGLGELGVSAPASLALFGWGMIALGTLIYLFRK